MNLLDPDSIDAYLDGFLPSDPAAAGLLRLALSKVLRRRAGRITASPPTGPHRSGPHVAAWISAAPRGCFDALRR